MNVDDLVIVYRLTNEHWIINKLNATIDYSDNRKDQVSKPSVVPHRNESESIPTKGSIGCSLLQIWEFNFLSSWKISWFLELWLKMHGDPDCPFWSMHKINKKSSCKFAGRFNRNRKIHTKMVLILMCNVHVSGYKKPVLHEYSVYYYVRIIVLNYWTHFEQKYDFTNYTHNHLYIYMYGYIYIYKWLHCRSNQH